MILEKNKIGLAFGLFLSIVHAIWSFFIAVIPGPLQSFLNWIFGLHTLEPALILTTFNFLNAVLLVVISFVFGYIFGWLYALTHNLIHHSK